MIFIFIKIALFGIVLCDVSEIIHPSRDNLPPSSESLSHTGHKLLVTSGSTPVISASAALLKEYVEAPSLSLFYGGQDIQGKHIPQLSNSKLKVNRGDIEVLTNNIASPRSVFTAAPQTVGVIATNSKSTKAHSETSYVVKPPQSESQYEHNAHEEAASTQQEVSENDPLIRINASELADVFDEQISELPSEQIEVAASTPETLLSEDGYHYSIPQRTFGSIDMV